MMKYLKKFENHNEPDTWIISLKNEDLDIPVFKILPDISDNVKEGDIIIGVWFTGGFDAYLCKIEYDPDNGFGCSDGQSWYSVEYAWGVFDPKEYDSHTDKKIELALVANKYNL